MDCELPDVQKSTEGFPKREIHKVGMRGVKVPMKVFHFDKGYIEVLAKVSAYCNVPADMKGANLSRNTRTLIDCVNEADMPFDNLSHIAEALRKAHDSDSVYVKASFDYHVNLYSPLSGLLSYEPVKVTFESIFKNGVESRFMTIKTTEYSVCPCSREMSLLTNNLSSQEQQELSGLSESLRAKIAEAGFGAHSQKSIIEIKIQVACAPKIVVSIEQLLGAAKKSASAPTWTVLKRPDEKYVTEVGYMGGYFDETKKLIPVEGAGAKFVEDIARQCVENIENIGDPDILGYTVVVNNQESIHSDDIMATAVISSIEEI